jgi:hypothetical protein
MKLATYIVASGLALGWAGVALASTCVITSGPADFQCGANKGVHIFLDKGKGVTSTTAEFPKSTSADDVVLTFSSAANVANGFANIKPDPKGSLLTTITFTFSNPRVSGFLFRGELNEDTSPIVVTVMDQSNVAEVFNYSGSCSQCDIGDLGFHQAIAGETINSVSLFTSGGWFEGKQYEVTPAVGGAVPEPASWIMMGVGLGCLGAFLRSSQRKGLSAVAS